MLLYLHWASRRRNDFVGNCGNCLERPSCRLEHFGSAHEQRTHGNKRETQLTCISHVVDRSPRLKPKSDPLLPMQSMPKAAVIVESKEAGITRFLGLCWSRLLIHAWCRVQACWLTGTVLASLHHAMRASSPTMCPPRWALGGTS